MADQRLTDGVVRFRLAMDMVSGANSKLSIIQANTFANWVVADGDMGGFITTLLAGRPLADVGFFASYTPITPGTDPIAILAVDISGIDPLNFT